MNKEENTISLFDDDGKNVTKFIKEGKTFFVESKENAIIIANQIRSYFYPVHNDKSKHVGLVIPK